jgi:hypothetical protein
MNSFLLTEFSKAAQLANQSEVIILVVGIDTDIEDEMRDRFAFLSLKSFKESIIID